MRGTSRSAAWTSPRRSRALDPQRHMPREHRPVGQRARRSAGEMPAQVVAMAAALQRILDHPIVCAHAHRAPVHRVVHRAADLAFEHVPVAAEEHGPRRWQRRAPARVRRLVEPVDGDGVVRGRAAEPAPLRLGVREAPRVEHERRLSRPRLDAQRVVVAVPAVAQRPAVEDQEALARALHEVAAVGEVVACLHGGVQHPGAAAARSRPCRCPTAPGSSRRGAGSRARTHRRRPVAPRTRPAARSRSGGSSRPRRRTSAARPCGNASTPRGARRRTGSRRAGSRAAPRPRSRRRRSTRAPRSAARTARAYGGCAPAPGSRARGASARGCCRRAAGRPRAAAARRRSSSGSGARSPRWSRGPAGPGACGRRPAAPTPR